MNRTSANLALPALLCLLLDPCVNVASASSAYGRQSSDMAALATAVYAYRDNHGEYPKTDSQSTWFQKLVSDDPSVRQCVHFGTTPDGSLPTDMYGFAIVYEPPADPNDRDQFAVFRCVGKNGVDDKGRLDDWDIRYGPNLGYWEKASWLRLYIRTGVCALLAPLGVVLLTWRVRPRWWALYACALWVGLLAFAVVPGFDGGYFRTSASTSPRWSDVVALCGLVPLLIGLFGAHRRFSPWHIRRRRRESDCCAECGHDLHETLAVGRGNCPECDALIPLSLAGACDGEAGN